MASITTTNGSALVVSDEPIFSVSNLSTPEGLESPDRLHINGLGVFKIGGVLSPTVAQVRPIPDRTVVADGFIGPDTTAPAPG